MTYRKDVQMLRGIAVLLVVLFHLELARFHSGFLGVDVFFVISGYLMAVIYRPKEIGLFFSRRARRLLPAYYAIVIATALAALAVTVPTEFSQVATQTWFATFFVPNVGYWLDNSYFDKSAFKPLLHLWSVGVEIQFYLLVPAVYWFLIRTRAFGYAVLVAGSTAGCFLMVSISPKTSFFWLPFRLWEFLFGFGVAKYLASGRRVPALPWIGALCFVAILLIPMLPVDGTTPGFRTGHPGLMALVIVTATAGVLFFGLPRAGQANPVADGLEKLGDWSYSVYLAHFPVIVLMLYQPFSGTLLAPKTPLQMLAVIGGIAVASAAVYRFVERPFRHKPVNLRWAAVTAVAAVLPAAAGAWVQALLLPAPERAIYAAWDDRAPYRCGKLNRVLHPEAQSCTLTEPAANPSARILLVGNSHADSIKDTFAAAAQARGAAVYFLVDNTPLMDGGMRPEALIQEASARRVGNMVLHYSPGAVPAAVIAQVTDLASARGIAVSFLMPVPVWDRHVPRMLWSASKGAAAVSHQSIEDYRQRNAVLVSELSPITVRGLRVYDIAPELCKPDCRLTNASGAPLYFDATHLTLSGSALLRPLFDRVIGDLVQRRRAPQNKPTARAGFSAPSYAPA